MTILQSVVLLCVATLITVAILMRNYSSRALTAAFFSGLWLFHCGNLLQAQSLPLGIFSPSFVEQTGFFHSFAMALSCGVLPILLLGKGSWLRLYAGGFVLLLVCFNLYLIGDILAYMIFGSTPAILLGKLTIDGRWVGLRSTLQTVSWLCTYLWFLPSLLFSLSAQSWQVLIENDLIANMTLLWPMLLPMGLLAIALYQFAIEGEGTAFPFDPPLRLVKSGIYGYISNPMQLSICTLLAYWGYALQSVLVMMTALVALLLFVVFKDVCNGSCAIGKKDPLWSVYQANVPKWLPRRTPWQA